MRPIKKLALRYADKNYMKYHGYSECVKSCGWNCLYSPCESVESFCLPSCESSL